MTRMSKHCFAASACLTLIGCALPSKQTVQEKARQQWDSVRGGVKLQLAENQLSSGALEEARRTAAEAVALDSRNPTAYALLAQVEIERGDLGSADRALHAARDAGAESAQLLYLAGVVAEYRSDFETAAALYRQARGHDPRAASEYIMAEAECLAALDRVDEALTLVDEARRDDPSDAGLAVLAAHLAELKRDPAAALARYNESILRVEDSRLASEQYALLLVNAERWLEAVALLEPLVQDGASPARGRFVRALAGCYLNLDRPVDGCNVLDPYLTTHPADGRAHLLYAQCALSAGRLDDAARAAQRACELDPADADPWLVTAMVRWTQGDTGGAWDAAAIAADRQPDSVTAQCLLGELQRRSGNAADALRHFQAALHVEPDCAWAREGLRALKYEPLTAGTTSQ